MTPEQKERARLQVLQNLMRYGVHWDEERKSLSVDDFYELQRKLAAETNPSRAEVEPFVAHHVAKPSEINIEKIDPSIELVNGDRVAHRRLWAYATSFWSIPVTVGYGRRLRFFVFDRQNNKLIGIFGLCDPIIGLDMRDNVSIGWTVKQKTERLYNCMTAYVLGAIPPYNLVLGGKLIALSVMFPQVREIFQERYGETARSRNKAPQLVYIDSLGAFGKAAIYTRLKNWTFVGYTKGQSHIHITANGSWPIIKEVVPKEVFDTYKYGQGPNWKMRVLRHGLRELGLASDMLSIGWRRAYYRCPVATNWKEFLTGKSQNASYMSFTPNQLTRYWLERWVLPRRERLEAALRLDQVMQGDEY